MRPFRSVGQALGFFFEQAQRLSSANSLAPRPKVQGLDAGGRAADVMAAYLSVSLCLEVLGDEERQCLFQRFWLTSCRREKGPNRIYHRAMVKLGKEMRRRGVVG